MEKKPRLFRRLAINLAAASALVCFLGIGKANCMYFIGLKRAPGLDHSIFVKSDVTAFGVIALDDEIKANYAYILFSYCPRTGITFLRQS